MSARKQSVNGTTTSLDVRGDSNARRGGALSGAVARRTAVLSRVWWLVLVCIGANGCGREPIVPFGEVIVEIHTDVEVPKLVSRLRVDFFDERGAWYLSRDISAPSPAQWPLSFSVVSNNLAEGGRTFLRLRAYPAGGERAYLGERFWERPPYTPPRVPLSLTELCQQAQTIVPPETVWVRRGQSQALATAILPEGDCDPGDAAWRPLDALNGVHVDIAEAGAYRFEILDTYPAMGHGTRSDNVLFLRSACDDASTQLACNDDLGITAPRVPDGELTASQRPRLFVEHLAPGRYTLFIGSRAADPVADLRLRVAPADAWEEAPPPETDPWAPPRWIDEGSDDTPVTEPEPALTIDRLLEVVVDPGVIRRQVVALRGACVGTMARLSRESAPERLVPDAAESCIDSESERLPVIGAPAGDPPPGIGSFGSAPCPAGAARDDVVCVPGGAFVLGDRTADADDAASLSSPERVARLQRFWLDRREVTVARYRSYLQAVTGTDEEPPDAWKPRNNPTPIHGDNTGSQCSWDQTEAHDREGFPLSCIPWQGARAFCKRAAGDLPTEAQWEYAATAAGVRVETPYPWQETSPPSCERAIVFGRMKPLAQHREYFGEVWLHVSDECGGYGPLDVDDERGADDVTSLGLKGMGGNLSEWVRDAGYPYGGGGVVEGLDRCWGAQPLDEPACLDDNPPLRSVRGGSWAFGAYWLAGALRGFRVPDGSQRFATYIGFRCAYTEPPPEPEAGE